MKFIRAIAGIILGMGWAVTAVGSQENFHGMAGGRSACSRTDDLDRAGRGTKNSLCHATQQKAPYGAVTVRADHNQVCVPFFGGLGDSPSRKTHDDLGKCCVLRARELLDCRVHGSVPFPLGVVDKHGKFGEALEIDDMDNGKDRRFRPGACRSLFEHTFRRWRSVDRD